jgi:hypothetical protein
VVSAGEIETLPAMLPFKGGARSKPVWVLDHTGVQSQKPPRNLP